MFLSPDRNLKEASVSQNMIVADFDAGAGYYTFAASRLVGEKGRVYAIDMNAELLERIKNESKRIQSKNIEIIKANLESKNGSGLKEESVDLVVIANSFFIFENKKAVVEEAFRILHKGGRVLFVEWLDSFAGFGPHIDHIIKKEDARKIFEEESFVFAQEINAGSHHYGFIFRKK